MLSLCQQNFLPQKTKNGMACMTWFPELVSPQLKTLLCPCEKAAVRGSSWVCACLAKCAFYNAKLLHGV